MAFKIKESVLVSGIKKFVALKNDDYRFTSDWKLYVSGQQLDQWEFDSYSEQPALNDWIQDTSNPY